MADLKDKLPTPPGENKPSDKGVSHGCLLYTSDAADE